MKFHLKQWILSLLGQLPKKMKQQSCSIIIYNDYRRKKQHGPLIYVCTIKSYPCVIISKKKNTAIKKLDCTNHNHDPKLIENVQNVLTGLKR